MGIRPGEKLHEVLVSQEEMKWTTEGYEHYIINSMLPELKGESGTPASLTEYSSEHSLVGERNLRSILKQQGYIT